MREEQLRSSMFVSLGGWRGAGLLLAMFLLLEIGLPKIGGDSAAFLYVTFHFIVAPLLSICLLVATGLKAYRTKDLTARLLTLSSLIVPGLLLYNAFTGSTWLPELLGVDFNK